MDQHPTRIRKTDRSFENKLNFEDIKFLVKIKDIHKIEKKGILSFLVIKIRKNI